MTPKPNSISQAQGVFSNCGPGIDTYELRYHCKGPACASIRGFRNVLCHEDGDGMTCSNSVVCPEGISSYYSNFTFGQNEADPWSPNSANEPDTWVSQQQHISLPNCARFSLISDGTRGGTTVNDEGTEGKNVCREVQQTPTAHLSGGFGKKPTSNVRPQAVVTSKPKVVESSSGSRCVSRGSIAFTILLALLMLLPGAHASSEHIRRAEIRQQARGRVRDVSNKVKLFAQNLNGELAQKANAHGFDGEVFAHNLVADVVSSVCDWYFHGVEDKDFAPSVVENCLKGIYGGDRLGHPGDQFFAVFGASLLCNYVVSEAYPVAQEFLPDGCEGLQELSERLALPIPDAEQYVKTSIIQQSSLLPMNGVFKAQSSMTSQGVVGALTPDMKTDLPQTSLRLSAALSNTIRTESSQADPMTDRDQSVSTKSVSKAMQNLASGTPIREKLLGTTSSRAKTVSNLPLLLAGSATSRITAQSDQASFGTLIPLSDQAHELLEATLSLDESPTSNPERLNDLLSPSRVSETRSTTVSSSQPTSEPSSKAKSQSLSLTDKQLASKFTTSSSHFRMTSQVSTTFPPRISLSSSSFASRSAKDSPTSIVRSVDATSSTALSSFLVAESTVNSFSGSRESTLKISKSTASLQSKGFKSRTANDLSLVSSVKTAVRASSITHGRISELSNTALGNVTARLTVLSRLSTTMLIQSVIPSLSYSADTQSSSALASRTLILPTTVSIPAFTAPTGSSLSKTSSSLAQQSTSHVASSHEAWSSSTDLSSPAATPTPVVCPIFVPDLCGDTCVIYSTDILNCGSCGTECSQGWQCVSGACQMRSTPKSSTPKSGTMSPKTAVGSSIMVSTTQTSTLRSSTSTHSPEPEGVGGFIAKGFDGLW